MSPTATPRLLYISGERGLAAMARPIRSTAAALLPTWLASTPSGMRCCGVGRIDCQHLVIGEFAPPAARRGGGASHLDSFLRGHFRHDHAR